MIRELEGSPLLTAFGKPAGRVERVYADQSGKPHYALVRWGTVPRRRLVPLERVHLTPAGLYVPYSLHVVHDSPLVPTGAGPLQIEHLHTIDEYYARHVNHGEAARITEVIEAGLVRERIARGEASGEAPSGHENDHSLKGRLLTFVHKLMRDNVGMLASVIAWATLTSVVPIMVGLVAITGLLLRDPATQATVIGHLSNALQGVLSTKDIASIVHTSTNHTGLLGMVGLLGILWGGSNVGGALSTAFQAVFEVNGRNFVKEKLIDAGMIFVFAALMVVIIAATSAGALLNSLVGGLPVGGAAQFLIGAGIATLAALLLFTAIYLVFPNTDPHFRLNNVWKGALVSAVLFEILSFIWPLYANFSHFHRYGAVLFPVLLLTAWIYFFALITVIGAEVVAFSTIREANRDRQPVGPAPQNAVPQHTYLRADPAATSEGTGAAAQ